MHWRDPCRESAPARRASRDRAARPVTANSAARDATGPGHGAGRGTAGLGIAARGRIKRLKQR